MEPISVKIDFTELMEFTVYSTDRVLKAVDNIIRLEEQDDIVVLSGSEDFDISEGDDVVIFKKIIDKFQLMRDIEHYQESIIMSDSEFHITNILIPWLEETKEALEEIGDRKIEEYKFVINDQIFDAQYAGKAEDYNDDEDNDLI